MAEYPTRECKLDELLAARLRPLGFDVTIIPTPEPGKSHLIARLHDPARRAELSVDGLPCAIFRMKNVLPRDPGDER